MRAKDLLIVAGLVLAAAAARADEVSEAYDASLAAQRAARESQLRVNKLDDEARALRQKRRHAEWRALQLSAYAAQLEEEAQNEEKKRAQLEDELKRIAATGTDLQPLLRRMVAELGTAVENDLPFLHETRRARVAGLRTLIEEPQRPSAEKFRRVMEAYRSEVEYGHSMGTEDAELDCAGVQGQAVLVRVGRLGLYCLTADGRHAGYWEAGARRWQALDDDGLEEVQRAEVIARGKAPPELLVLPVRKP